MRWGFAFVLLFQCLFAEEGRHVGILVNSLGGELSFAYRLQAACENLHWKADMIHCDSENAPKEANYDFVISLVADSYKYPDCKNYQAIFIPKFHYFRTDGYLKPKYRKRDGYLLTYSFEETPRRNKKWHLSRAWYCDPVPFISWYPTVQKREYTKVDPRYLFHLPAIWGNRLGAEKFQKLCGLLDQESFVRCYGNPAFQSLYPRSYRSAIPFDADSVCDIASEAGVSLVLHSAEHNHYRVPSGRIFEAAAASTVIVCDENAFVKKHFGDSVLYINTEGSAESIHQQILDYMHWIRKNPSEALAKARQAYEIYRENFVLEDQLLRLGAFHDQISKRGFWSKLLSPFRKHQTTTI